MNGERFFNAALALVTLVCGGCGYRGALYSSYQEIGLGIRTTAESTAPVKVHFGYDRSVAAFVPRRGGDAKSEEVTALISKDDVGVNVNPFRPTALGVDSAFITGTAAIVASAPDGATVKVVATCSDAANQTSQAVQSFAASGPAGSRIATALALKPALLSADQMALRSIHAKIDAKPEQQQDQIYTRAAAAMPPAFKAAYDDRVKAGRSPADAFFVAETDYLDGQPDAGPRHQELFRALNDANGGVRWQVTEGR